MANIILCSDGTGNSGGKDNGTNVWRLYQAVDLTGRDQIVFHDDGVGTHEHKILKTIGGAFGWGLSQNIKDLYTSLVRVYNEGDEIFLFGFSRGAYTARALAGLITNFGVLDRYQYRTPGELNKAVDRLFDAYRKLPKHDDPEKSAALNIEEFRKWCCDEWSDQEWDELKNSSEYSVTKREIRFLGVWDTVDAIGVPFDELREWFGPKVLGKRSYDHDLNPRILNVAHAIAIDDQRKTFHPVMFSEGLAGPEQVVDQVWFTGMHSNIGGGYPKDSLSLNTLVWMIDRAIAASVKGKGPVLSFIEGEIDRYRDTANSHGMMYDSRTGVKAFYRYRPRDIEKFCKTACKDGRPVIHESVFERIADRTAGYAPANIPANYRIWTTGEAEDDEASRYAVIDGSPVPELKQASDTARWFAACRIPLYFVMLYSTLFVGAVSLVFSSLHVPDPSVSVDPFIALLAGVISAIVPDMIGGYIECLFKHWWWLTLFVGVFGILGWARGFFLRATRDTASLGWRYQALVNLDKEKGNEKSNKERVDLSATIGELQASRGTAFWWAVEGSGVARNAGILIACAIFIAASWVLVSTRFDGDFQAACALIEAKSLETDEKTQVFATRNPCHRTRWDVNSGEPVFLQVEASGWFDKTISATPSGFVSKAHEESKLMNDFRHSLRNPDAKYFTLLGQVLTYGEEGVASVRWRERLDFTLFGWHFMDSFGINRSVARAVQRFEASDVKDALSGSFSDAESSGKFSRVEDHSCGNNIFKWTPPETGELTLFVNDVDMAKAKLWPESLSWSADWWFPANRYSFYENNRGSAIVSRIDPMSCKLWEEQTRSN